MNYPLVSLQTAEGCKGLLSVPDKEYRRGLPTGRLARITAGQSILGVYGDDWARQHRILYKVRRFMKRRRGPH